jgi:predicted component of type VI protein secretion system
MTSQEYADLLLAHWRLLWPLGPQERAKRFAELRLDYEFEEQLSLVSIEMANPEHA